MEISTNRIREILQVLKQDTYTTSENLLEEKGK